MKWLKNLSLFPMHARFAIGITGVGSFWHRGVERCLNNSPGIQKIVNRGGYYDIYRYGYTALTGHLCLGSEDIGLLARSMSGVRMFKLQHDSSLHPNLLEKPSTIGHKIRNSVRQEHSVSREWLAKRWAEEQRRKDVMRRRKRRYAQRVETKEPTLDTSLKFPFLQSFFTRSIPADQGWQTNEPSMQPPLNQYEEGFLYPQTPEEVKLAPLLARSNLLITRDIEWANIMFAFEQENRYAMVDPCYPQSPVGFIREQSNVLTRQLLRTRRPFIAYITDARGNEIFRVRRPFWWITSTIYAEVDGKEIGVVCRRWHLWRRLYDLYFGNKQFAVVENPGLWNWTFTLKDENDNVLAQIDRDWRGFGFELFTDAGQYVIRFGNAYSIPKIGFASAVQELDVKRPLTLSERAVTVALAISLDNDFFSRTGGGWGLPIIVAGE
ncbi:hypothetical protein KFK09_017909 [Dendrobium nobile]|uniref:Phospholipid scramblase n=1 Tax=Dendrobium nobile TaxID=94219 RepID=A0A8T3AUB5_DENNO|nr:hypothetical protein KFK09_017909 [Dendrobium nobile]